MYLHCVQKKRDKNPKLHFDVGGHNSISQPEAPLVVAFYENIIDNALKWQKKPTWQTPFTSPNNIHRNANLDRHN